MSKLLVSREQVLEAHAYYLADPDRTLREVAEVYGSSARNWSRRFTVMALPVKPGGRGRNVDSSSTRLSTQQVLRLRRMISEGVGVRRIMREFRIGAGRATRLIRHARSGNTADQADRPQDIS